MSYGVYIAQYKYVYTYISAYEWKDSSFVMLPVMKITPRCAIIILVTIVAIVVLGLIIGLSVRKKPNLKEDEDAFFNYYYGDSKHPSPVRMNPSSKPNASKSSPEDEEDAFFNELYGDSKHPSPVRMNPLPNLTHPLRHPTDECERVCCDTTPQIISMGRRQRI
uniref:Uncharacterized protein n=1 Tax=Trichobilharzia regenti TaxID=157069 RepID=A0AA85KBK8_TRIRE|nr:unnamed protein product [Trichobilharzia regenti]